MRSLQHRRSLRGGCLPSSSQMSRITPLLLKHRKKVPSMNRFSTRAFRNPRPLLLSNLTRRRLGDHRHPHTRQNTSRHRNIGIPTLPSCGSLQNMNTLIRCIPAPALFITRSRITRLTRILRQRRVTRHRYMDIINPRMLSRRPKCVGRQCASLLRRRQF